MRNATLKGAAAVFAATLGVTVWAEDTTYHGQIDDSGTEVRIQSDGTSTDADLSTDVQTPSTQPADRTHLNDQADETSVGTDATFDGARQDNMSDSPHTGGQSGASLNDNPTDTTPAAEDQNLGASGEIRADDDLDADTSIDTGDTSVSGSAEIDADMDADVDSSGADADISVDGDAEPAAARMEDSDEARDSDFGPQPGASMNDNPNDSSPADDKVREESEDDGRYQSR